MDEPSKIREWGPVATICLVALVLRLVYFSHIRDLFFIDHLGLDAKYYDHLARQIAGGDIFGHEVFFFGPLYPYSLAILYTIFGVSLTVARLSQFLLGAVGCALIYQLGKQCFSRRVGYLAAGLGALHAPLIMYQGTILYDQLGAILVILILMAFIRAQDSARWQDSMVAGALLGLMALGRANVLLFLPFVFLLYLPTVKKTSHANWAQAGRRWFFVLLGCVLVIVPVTMRNLIVGGELVLITANGGLNFYIGNGPEASGGYVMPSGVDIRYDFAGRQLAEADLGHKLSYYDLSRYWFAKAKSHVQAHPFESLKLLFHKMALFWCSFELPQIEHYDFMRQYSWVLRLPHLAFGFLAPLGIVGLIVTIRGNRKVYLLFLFLLAYFLSVVVFFVAGRYRLPIHPVLMVLAAAAIFWGWDRVKERHYQAVIMAAGGWMLLSGLSHWPLWAKELPNHLAEKHFQVGSVAELQGRTTEALEHYQKAVTYEPCHVKALLNLALVYAQRGNVAAAERSLREAIRCDPTYAKAYFNLAILYSRHGRTTEAENLLRETTRINREYGEAWRSLGLLYAASGRIDAARQAFHQVLEIPVTQLSPRGSDKLRQEAQSFLEQLRDVPEGQAVTDFQSP